MVGLIKTVPGENFHINVISRKEWGAIPPADEIPKMLIPLANARFTHTGTEQCSTQAECKKVLKKIQFEHMDTLGHKDITYNFMIGGDGLIFEGRGWETEPDRPSLHNNLQFTSVDIAYIGDFSDEKPPPVMMRAAFELLLHGIRTKLIHHYFEGIHLS